MDENGLLVKVLAFIAVVIATGWFISFVIVPVVFASIGKDYQPQPEVTIAMTAVITSIAGLLGSVWLKAKRARDTEDGPDGDGNGQ